MALSSTLYGSAGRTDITDIVNKLVESSQIEGHQNPLWLERTEPKPFLFRTELDEPKYVPNKAGESSGSSGSSRHMYCVVATTEFAAIYRPVTG